MARNISFALTTQQFLDGSKTVTRRLGWDKLRVGDILCAVEKGQGLKPGEKVKRLGMIRIADVRREPLCRITDDLNYGLSETAKEGFPDGSPYHSPREFVKFFCASHRPCEPGWNVTRIEFERLPDETATNSPSKAGEVAMAESPVRIQLRRTAGWRMPPNTPTKAPEK